LNIKPVGVVWMPFTPEAGGQFSLGLSTEVVGRRRKDARLCFTNHRKLTDASTAKKFFDKDVRQDNFILWQKTRIHFGGAWRDISYKGLNNVFYQRGAGTHRLCLQVIAPHASIFCSDSLKKIFNGLRIRLTGSKSGACLVP